MCARVQVRPKCTPIRDAAQYAQYGSLRLSPTRDPVSVRQRAQDREDELIFADLGRSIRHSRPTSARMMAMRRTCLVGSLFSNLAGGEGEGDASLP